MSRSFIGMMAGFALAFAACFGGFVAFVLVAGLGAAGFAVGAWLDGGGSSLELREMFERNRR
ncbi:hypothetical protein ABZ829_09280 [Streptomyces xanthochromogenes]|uniref:hypothetical protein n=1 Tax=Streptomyces xanthochromogenes TaxID=67384 RepID=UPI003434D2C5